MKELSREVLDQIIFGMEDQEQRYVLDAEEGIVVSAETLGDLRESVDKGRYMSLPEWNSSMGFQLMEKFVATLRNPVFREKLRESLSAGRGVFRRFKNVLKDRPDIERMWFQFKERELRKYVIEWYESSIEAEQLASMQIEGEEETRELVLSDFIFKHGDLLDLEQVIKLDQLAYMENYPDLPEVVVEDMHTRDRVDADENATELLVASTPDADLAGFVWAQEYRLEDTESVETVDVSRILQLYVAHEYRGLGLAKTLMERYLEAAHERGIALVFASAGGVAVGCGDKLEEVGFQEITRTLQLDLIRWGLENS
jgi:GNAT superfamily N-acetyltransferase